MKTEPKLPDELERLAQSIEIQQVHSEIKDIVLVDDIVARGSTAVGIAGKIKEVYPSASIKLFAAIRTISNANEFKKLTGPCVGKIEMNKRGAPIRTP